MRSSLSSSFLKPACSVGRSRMATRDVNPSVCPPDEGNPRVYQPEQQRVQEDRQKDAVDDDIALAECGAQFPNVKQPYVPGIGHGPREYHIGCRPGMRRGARSKDQGPRPVTKWKSAFSVLTRVQSFVPDQRKSASLYWKLGHAWKFLELFRDLEVSTDSPLSLLEESLTIPYARLGGAAPPLLARARAGPGRGGPEILRYCRRD